jgi:hypothetical protein
MATRHLYSDEIAIAHFYIEYINKYGTPEFPRSTWYSWLSKERSPSRQCFVQLAEQFDIVRITELRKANMMPPSIFEKNQRTLRKWCEARRIEFCSSKFAHEDHWKHRERMVKEYEQPVKLELDNDRPYYVFHFEQTEPMEEWQWRKELEAKKKM